MPFQLLQSDLLRLRQQHHGGNIFDNHQKLRQTGVGNSARVFGKMSLTCRTQKISKSCCKTHSLIANESVKRVRTMRPQHMLVTSSLFPSSAARLDYVPGRTEWCWCASFTRSSVEWLSSGQWRVGIASLNGLGQWVDEFSAS